MMQMEDRQRGTGELQIACDGVRSAFYSYVRSFGCQLFSTRLIRFNGRGSLMTPACLPSLIQPSDWWRSDWQMLDPNLALLSPCSLAAPVNQRAPLSLQGDSSWSRMWRLKDFFVPEVFWGGAPFLFFLISFTGMLGQHFCKSMPCTDTGKQIKLHLGDSTSVSLLGWY